MIWFLVHACTLPLLSSLLHALSAFPGKYCFPCWWLSNLYFSQRAASCFTEDVWLHWAFTWLQCDNLNSVYCPHLKSSGSSIFLLPHYLITFSTILTSWFLISVLISLVPLAWKTVYCEKGIRGETQQTCFQTELSCFMATDASG